MTQAELEPTELARWRHSPNKLTNWLVASKRWLSATLLSGC